MKTHACRAFFENTPAAEGVCDRDIYTCGLHERALVTPEILTLSFHRALQQGKTERARQRREGEEEVQGQGEGEKEVQGGEQH